MHLLEQKSTHWITIQRVLRIAAIGYWIMVLLSLLFISSILFGFQPPTAAPIEFTANGNNYSFICPVGSLH